MHPQIIKDEPGSCPICGMDLVEKVSERGSEGLTVRINPEVINNMGVRTALAEKGRLWRRIDTVGYVDYNETGLSHVHLRTDGWIERLYVNSVGQRVQAGDRLLDIYSPTLVNAQEEYLQALASGNKSLLQASYDRLLSLGVSKDQIGKLKKSGRVSQTTTIYARKGGVVSRLNTPEGMYVKPASEVMSLADLSSIWLLAEVFEQQVDWVKEGQPAEVSLSFLPGRQWEGQVEYIYPELDPVTRTLKVRLRFDNPDELLKPNMYAKVSIYTGAKNNIVFIPREALIRTGLEQRVILDLGEGRYAPRKVKAGLETGDYVEILEGLSEGEKVVTSGQFLIDSEASLKASLMRMSGG
jgi:Cu(I)/Ag(I) efflux system membrane fusion protein